MNGEPSVQEPTGTVTFLFSDIEGSTRLVRELGDGYPVVLHQHRSILRAAFDARQGVVVDVEGDGFFVAFAHARDAVAAALDAQRALGEQQWPPGTAVRVRMGIHAGDAMRTEDGYAGLAVHQAARVCEAANGGQVLLSELAGRLVADALPPEATLRDLGLHDLRDFSSPQHVFQLCHPSLREVRTGIRSLSSATAVLFVRFDAAAAASEPAVRRTIERALAAVTGARPEPTGDGQLLTFDDPIRALRSATAIQQVVDRHNRRSPHAVSVRIGGDLSNQREAVAAQTLARSAEGGQIIFSAPLVTTLKTGGHLTAAALTATHGQGGSPAFTVAWSRSDPTTLPAALLLEERTSFVGRSPELRQLVALWRCTQDDDARPLVLVAGEPGIGKSALVRHLARYVRSAGGEVLFGRCDEEVLTPYQPFVEALQSYFKDLPDGLRDVGALHTEIARLVPALSELLTRSTPSPGGFEPAGEQYRLFEAVVDLLETVASQHELLLVLEDLHWADQSTLLLLRHIARHVRRAPVMVVGTYRDAEVDAGRLGTVIEELSRDADFKAVHLAGFSEEEAAALLHEMNAELTERFPLLIRLLNERTEGNPLFLYELTRSLLERVVLDLEDPNEILDLARTELAVPESLKQLIARRFSRLSPGANRVMRIASVIGEEFAMDVLSRVSGFGDEVVLDALEEAATIGVIRPSSTAPDRFRFSHGLMRETLYADMLAARRRRLHARVGNALEELAESGRDVSAAELSYHYSSAARLGHDSDKAIAYAIEAAKEAIASLAYDEAVSHYEQALDLSRPQEAGGRFDLMLALGEVQRRSGDPRYRQTLLDAARLAQELQDGRRLAAAALANSRGFWSSTLAVDAERVAALESALAMVGEDDSYLRARLLANLAVELVYADTFDENRRRSDEALAIARRLGDLTTMAHVLLPRYNTIRGDPSTLAERLANTAELVDIAEALGDRTLLCWASGWRALALLEAAQGEEAKRSLLRFTELAAELRQPTLLWYATYMKASMALFEGRFEESWKLSDEAFVRGQNAGHPDAKLFVVSQRIRWYFETEQLSEEHDLLEQLHRERPGSPTVKAARALVYAELGQLERAADVFEEAAATGFAIPFEPTWLHALATYAVIAARLQHGDGAAVLFERLHPYADQIVTLSSLTYIGSACYYLGLLAGTLGRFRDADGYFARAAATHASLGAPAWLARTEFEWGRLLLEQGGPARRGQAMDLLAGAIDAASTLGMGVTVDRGRQLLRRAEVEPAREQPISTR